jgi:hypothetical protein
MINGQQRRRYSDEKIVPFARKYMTTYGYYGKATLS